MLTFPSTVVIKPYCIKIRSIFSPQAPEFMSPFSASPEFLEACGIEPRTFMEWRGHAEAAGLDNNWDDVLPTYFWAQAKRAKDYKLGQNAVQDMIVLGITKEGAKGWLYGHRSPFEWAEMLVEGLMPAR